LVRSVPALFGHNALSFKAQELLNPDESAFDSLILGKGYTWIAVLSVLPQAAGGLQDVNAFFGNLKNGGLYEGLWGGLDDDRTLWCGSRNGVTMGRWNSDNPKVSGPLLEAERYSLVAGRMGLGAGTVPLEMFVNQAGAPVAVESFPVNPAANASKMAIGTERDAVEHPGYESFDGAIARFLIYDRPLSDGELVQTFEALRRIYFTAPTRVIGSGKTAIGRYRGIFPRAVDLNGRDREGTVPASPGSPSGKQ